MFPDQLEKVLSNAFQIFLQKNVLVGEEHASESEVLQPLPPVVVLNETMY